MITLTDVLNHLRPGQWLRNTDDTLAGVQLKEGAQPLTPQMIDNARRALALKALRAERDRRLQASDWIVLREMEKQGNVPAAWKAYRQALRDMPSATEDFDNPVWPVEPTS